MMKKVLIQLILLMPCNAMAQTHVLTGNWRADTKVVCIEGYKYLITRTNDGVSTVQMMRSLRMSPKAVPIKCK
jgi:hypothetical protein